MQLLTTRTVPLPCLPASYCCVVLTTTASALMEGVLYCLVTNWKQTNYLLKNVYTQ